MRRLEWLAGLGLACVVFGAQPAWADSMGTTWPEEEEEEQEEAETSDSGTEEDEDEKGCSHVLQPQNLALAGGGLLLFTVVARRDPRPV